MYNSYKSVALFLILMVLSFLVITQCSKSEEPLNGLLVNNNLLTNSSFESEQNPTLSGWKTNAPDQVDFSQDVPQNGGNWSVEIPTVWGPPYMIYQDIKSAKGDQIYRLTFSAKQEGPGGSAALELMTADTTFVSKEINISSTDWNEYSLLDTIDAEKYDSIKVRFSGGINQLLQGNTYFDKCNLELVNAK